ncbi:U-box domain-containing protein 12 [Ananas comosus]|uniref:U-box domain-containing protein 12 n=1 Tax=Ananas comosus TaxID=4615 RepID=A0A199UM71_ANACO|nr:U-box domain-containing protein 12 [Ananas comosus]
MLALSSLILPLPLPLPLPPLPPSKPFFLTPPHSPHLRLRRPPDVPLLRRRRRLQAGATADDGGGAGSSSQNVKVVLVVVALITRRILSGVSSTCERNHDIEQLSRTVTSGEAYIGLFVRMLGLDNDPLDREHAIITLWQYSQGGRKCIDDIMQFPGCINLVTSLLKSESCSTCEAAAGLLRNVTSVKLYRDAVAESGAIEEISSLLCQSSIAPEVKEQGLFALWNLSVDEKLRLKIVESDLLPKLVRFLDDEEIKVKEAAGGILANLALSHANHGIMVEAGVIPKLADLLKGKQEGYKVIRKEAKTALLELCKDEYYRILIIEEGLVRVPVVGSAAYKAFKPSTHSWPSLPDGTEIQRNSRPSRYGASELLVGLNIEEKNLKLEEAKMNAIVGRSQQQFLVRIGAIEMEDGEKIQNESPQKEQYTLLPWIDGVARLVLILGLEDTSAIIRAAYSVADASVNEHMRNSFKEAGAVRQLVQLLHHDRLTVREAVAHALDKLSISNIVCRTIEAEGALEPLINILKDPSTPVALLEKTIDILSRIFDTGNGLKRMFDDKVVNGTEGKVNSANSSSDAGGFLQTLLKQEPMTRMEIIGYGIISRLIDLLRKASPSVQTKVASFLEYLANFEPHATSILMLELMEEDDTENQPEPTIVEIEEIGLATSAAARLLTKLLNFDQFNRTIDPAKYVIQLRKILKSDIPLHTKDWIAACLVKLESKFGSALKNVNFTVDKEVIIYETIPRLIEQIRTSFSYESKRAAVLELKRIISGGSMEFAKAVTNAGGIFHLVKLIEEGKGDVIESSLAILYNLSMDAENHPAIISAGAVPVLKRIILSEGPQWTRALHLLRTLPI